MRSSKDGQTSIFVPVLAVLLLASLIINGVLGTQLMKASSGEQKTVWLSSDSAIRSTISGEQHFGLADSAPEYDYAVGMRKNMQLSRENCVLDECFLNLDLELPAGKLPDSVARSLTALAVKEREVSSRIMADVALRQDTPLQKMQESQAIRVSTLQFMERKYGLTTVASEGVPLRSTDTDMQTSCNQLAEQLGNLQQAYNAELALDTIADYPDLAYVYRQLEAQTRTMHLPLVQSCAKAA